MGGTQAGWTAPRQGPHISDEAYARAVRAGEAAYAVARGQVWRAPWVWALALAAVGVIVGLVYLLGPFANRQSQLVADFARVTGSQKASQAALGEHAWNQALHGQVDALTLEEGVLCAEVTLANRSDAATTLGALAVGPRGAGAEHVALELSTPADAILPGGGLRENACALVGEPGAGWYAITVQTDHGPLSWKFELPL